MYPLGVPIPPRPQHCTVPVIGINSSTTVKDFIIIDRRYHLVSAVFFCIKKSPEFMYEQLGGVKELGGQSEGSASVGYGLYDTTSYDKS